MKGPFKAEAQADHWRISDRDDNRIATCYDPANAREIVQMLNECEQWRIQENARQWEARGKG